MKTILIKLKNIFKHIFLNNKIWILILKVDGKTYKIYPPKFYGWADPFLFKKNNKYYIFFESYSIVVRKGFLQCGEINLKTQKIGNVKTILKKDFHLSYPHVFEYDDNIYMIPESHENKTIDLYKCIDFPNKWIFEKNLIKNIVSVDSTMLFQKNNSYLFTSIQGNCKYISDNLTIFKSENLFGNFTKIFEKNIKGSGDLRNAGNFIKKGDSLYRVSQDCKGGSYGNKVNFYRINSQNFSKYDEIIEKTINLSDEIQNGPHTYNKIDNIEILDIKVNGNKSYMIFGNLLNIFYLIYKKIISFLK